MIERCYNKNDATYQRYGAKGVTVCNRWKDAKNFIEDNLQAYNEHAVIHGERNTTLDRIDCSKGYSPDNVRWVTYLVNGGNKPSVVKIEFKGVALHAAEWGRKLGIKGQIISNRLRNGWSVEDALTKPPRITSINRELYRQITSEECDRRKEDGNPLVGLGGYKRQDAS